MRCARFALGPVLVTCVSSELADPLHISDSKAFQVWSKFLSRRYRHEGTLWSIQRTASNFPTFSSLRQFDEFRRRTLEPVWAGAKAEAEARRERAATVFIFIGILSQRAKQRVGTRRAAAAAAQDDHRRRRPATQRNATQEEATHR